MEVGTAFNQPEHQQRNQANQAYTELSLLSMGFFIMIDTKTLGDAAGIQRQDVIDRSADRVIPAWAKSVIVGRFKRGRMDKPFTVTANNYQALLGDDPFNPSYTIVDDAFIAGASEVMVMRIGNPSLAGKPSIEVPVDPNDPNNPAAVLITGTAKVGELLTAVVSDSDGLPKDIAYKWIANGVEVGTARTYRVTEADKGKRLLVQVVFTDKKGFIESAASDVTEPVAALNKPASVVIKGTLRVGQTLINAITDANGVPSNIRYQWLADGVEVGTASTYKLTDSDKGKRISLQVTFIDNDGFEESATATTSTPVTALNNPASVAVYGDVRVGERLTAVIADANGVPSDVTYQWLADGTEVGNTSSYTPTETDKGKRLSVQVSFTDNDGFTEDVLSTTEPVKALNKPASVVINGIAKVGETLTATITDDNGVSSNIIYRWMVDGTLVATASRYRLAEADKGKAVTLRVIFTDNDGFEENVTSEPTAPVKALNKVASVAIVGITRVGETLMPVVTDANGISSDISYQWRANGVEIGTQDRYTLTEADKGKTVNLQVIFIDNDGFEENVTSEPTAPIQALNKPASVTINGVVKVGETLTATISDANGVSSSVSHQWLVNKSYVGMSASYTLTERDKGGRVSLRVMFVDGEGFNESVTSAQTAPVAATNYAASVIVEGVIKVGEVLTAIVSDANGVPSNIRYQWMINNIEVGTESTYTLTEADKGGIVSLYVAFTDNDGFSESALSAESEPVQPLNKPAVVTIVGVLQVGKTLKAVITDDNGVPTNIAYKWMADGVEVGTATTYEPSESDVGKKISLRTTFKDNDGILEDKTTTTTSFIKPARTVQPPPPVLPASTPFTFQTTNPTGNGELSVKVSLYEPSNDWALYRNGALLVAEGVENEGARYNGGVSDGYVSVSLYLGDDVVNNYELRGNGKRLELSHNAGVSNPDDRGKVDIKGFSAGINHYQLSVIDGYLTVPDKLPSNINSTESMFKNCNLFNQDLSGWNMVNVLLMDFMFSYCSSFNQPIGDWDVSNVVYMNRVFEECLVFNQPLHNWDTSSVVDMTGLFSGAISFNQPIGDWDVSKVESMDYMFIGAHKFNQDLSKWCVPSLDITIADYDTNAFEWTKPRPVWGTCPRGEVSL